MRVIWMAFFGILLKVSCLINVTQCIKDASTNK